MLGGCSLADSTDTPLSECSPRTVCVLHVYQNLLLSEARGNGMHSCKLVVSDPTDAHERSG